jgi:2-succinyl-6-hydroxy-2,4-cyclohexadiene-1-carboxylate synthase
VRRGVAGGAVSGVPGGAVSDVPRGAASGLPRATGFLARDGERLYYEVCGSGPDLVLCHGAGGNHAVWFQQVAWFAARGRRVTSWDQRGFGRSSDRAEQAGPAAATADLRALLDHLEIARADLVGQSMGGWAALGTALAEPARVRRLVLADTLGGAAPPGLAEQIRRIVTQLAAPPAQLGLHPAIDASLAARDPALAHLYQMLGGFGEPDLARVAPRLWATQHGADALARLDLPVLFVVGTRDPLFPPALVREAAALLPDARVVEVEGSGHSPYFEDAAAWNAAVAEFLEVA